MFRTAIKNLLGHKLRMFLTSFSIILGVSFVAGTYIFTDSIGKTFDNLFGEVFSGIDVTVRPKKADFGDSARGFDKNVLETVRDVEGVSIAEPGVAGYAQLVDAAGEPIGGQGPPTLGFSWTVEAGLNALKIEEGDGRPPQAAGEVVIDKATATTNNFSVGSKVKILFNGPAEEFTIVGIATFGSSDGLAGATLSAFELSEAQRLFNFADQFSEINVKATTGVKAEELQQRIAASLPEGLEAVTGQQQANEQQSDINEGLGFINTALLAFAGIAIFVGSFIIQNTFRIIVTQRSKELALLRAMGATKGQIVRLVAYEAFFIGLVSAVIGIFAGLLVSNAVRGLMNSVGFTLPTGPLTIEPRTVYVSLGVGVIITLLAALLPAIKASRVAPVEALRENEAAGNDKKSFVKRGVIGALMIAGGALSLISGLSGDTEQPLYAVGFGVVLLFIGVSVIAPILSVPLSRLIGTPLVRLRGIPARLARDNATRTPRRTASTAAALMIGVSLVTMLSILASTFKSNITTILEDSFPADLTISSRNIGDGGPGTAVFSSQVDSTVEALPEVASTTALRYQIEGVKIDGAVTFVAGIDPESARDVIRLGETEGGYDALARGGVMVNEKVVQDKGWQIGQTIDVEFARTGTQKVPLVATFSEAFDTDFLFDTQTYLKNFSTDDITLLAISFTDEVSDEDGKVAVEKALDGYAQLQIQDKGDLFETAETQIDQILGLFWGLLGFAIIIAVLGITNTLMLSISERTRELGMLRAIGMTRSQMRRMIRYESIIIALFGAVLGVSMGAFFAWAVLRALESEGISGYVVSPVQISLYFVLAILAGIFAAAWPARKAARMDVLKAIYHD